MNHPEEETSVQTKTNQLVTAGLFVALGLILPYATGHAFGVPGTILLPMHIPVLLCGLICGPKYGAASGLVIPVLSSVLTGMPAFYPMLPIMAVQLIVLGLVSGLIYRQMKRPLYLAIIAAMTAGWALYGLTFSVLMLAGGGTLKALSVTAAIAKGVPGLIIQLTLIPILVAALNRFRSGKQQADLPAADPFETAKQLIKSGEASCIVIQEGAIIHTASGRGVSPILKLYRGEPEKLAGAFVVDKIIGKAAAMILLLGKATAIYGEVMSAAAYQYLTERGVDAQYGRCVDVITARDEKGICPIEKSVLEIDDPNEGLVKIQETIAILMQNAG